MDERGRMVRGWMERGAVRRVKRANVVVGRRKDILNWTMGVYGDGVERDREMNLHGAVGAYW